MLLSAVYEDYTRGQLEAMLWHKHSQIVSLKSILATCAEHMHELGSDRHDLLNLIEDQHRKDWNYNANYSVGAYNQMRKYIAELEDLVGKEKALAIRSNPCKYLSSWWDETEPKLKD